MQRWQATASVLVDVGWVTHRPRNASRSVTVSVVTPPDRGLVGDLGCSLRAVPRPSSPLPPSELEDERALILFRDSSLAAEARRRDSSRARDCRDRSRPAQFRLRCKDSASSASRLVSGLRAPSGASSFIHYSSDVCEAANALI